MLYDFMHFCYFFKISKPRVCFIPILGQAVDLTEILQMPSPLESWPLEVEVQQPLCRLECCSSDALCTMFLVASLLLLVRPGAPSSVLATTSKARSP